MQKNVKNVAEISNDENTETTLNEKPIQVPVRSKLWYAETRWLVLRVGIPLRSWMFVCFVCRVLCR